MESISLDFHNKDIPIPTNTIYISMLVSMILSVCTRVRWKLAHYKHPEWKNNKENFGFKTPNSPPRDDDLKAFEDMMFDIPNRIKFRDPRNAYQKSLRLMSQILKGKIKLLSCQIKQEIPICVNLKNIIN